MNRIGYGAIPPAAQMRVMMNAARRNVAPQPSPVERMAAVAFYAGVALAAGALAAVAFILS